MKAGREMDALVAEKIMGARWVHFRNGLEPSGWTRFLSDDLYDGQYGDARGDEALSEPKVKPYSTNDATALLVLKKLLPRVSGRVVIDVFRNGHAEVWLTLDEDLDGKGAGETLALAICRAALAAVNAEVSA